MIQKEFLEKYNITEKDFKATDLKWEDLQQIYSDFENKRHQFEPTAKDIVERLLKVKKVHSVRYRIKDCEHLIEKIIRKKIENNERIFTIENYFLEIDDIIGVRALHLFKDDWDDIDNFIINTWKTKETPTVNIRNGDSEELTMKFAERNYKIKEHKYGYRSVHYILESSPTKQSYVAELQVRTIFEEGWSEIDHTIRYPYDLENPILKQYLLMFNRLAGNADEMGTYIKFLQTELSKRESQFNEILNEREKIIDELKSKIDKLKIDQKTKTEIGTSLEHLLKSSNNVSNPLTTKYYGGGIGIELKQSEKVGYFGTGINMSTPTVFFPNNEELVLGTSAINLYDDSSFYINPTTVRVTLPQSICSICLKPFTNENYHYGTVCKECLNNGKITLKK